MTGSYGIKGIGVVDDIGAGYVLPNEGIPGYGVGNSFACPVCEHGRIKEFCFDFIKT